MIVAIVGTTTDLTEVEYMDMRKHIALTIKEHPQDTVILSGGAKVVDKLVVEIAEGLGYKTQEFIPLFKNWQYYKRRNLDIANVCDELTCFTVKTHKQKCYHHNTPQDHEKTAGCWTLNRVAQQGKPTKLVIV